MPTVRTPRIIHVTVTDASGATHPATPRPRSQPLPRSVYRTPKPEQFGWVAMIIAVVGAFAVGAVGFTRRKSDFEIGIKILEQKCFGCVGCSVTYRIKPKYVGTQELN